MTILIY